MTDLLCKGVLISYVVGIIVAIIYFVIFVVKAYMNPKACLEGQQKIIIGRSTK